MMRRRGSHQRGAGGSQRGHAERGQVSGCVRGGDAETEARAAAEAGCGQGVGAWVRRRTRQDFPRLRESAETPRARVGHARWAPGQLPGRGDGRGEEMGTRVTW